ncbi:carbonic anhydrase-like [Saccostrea echinata]|uniref:carbonic anhydrase-like n=1 Tax=Saccostrea echinata TaxID=191078 RepID=UPI002A824A6B|nr:carbonic anhydrase-like [Saccostrea echinata]
MKEKQLVLRRITLILILHVSHASGSTWDYVDPSTWSNTYPICAETHQSPIDLLENITQETSHEYFTLEHHQESIHENMTNTGHSLMIQVSHDVKISGGGLQGKFKIDQFHFHWGSNSSIGSEHTIDGAHYPLELHVVAHNDSYSNFNDAKNHSDGLAVFGYVFQIGPTNNSHFDPFFSHLSDVSNKDEHHEVTFKLDDVMESSTMTSYFRYHGSLTTPECFQSVTWTVFDHPKSISEAQMEALRTLHSDNGTTIMEKNYRPVQQLNNRIVHKYKYTHSGAVTRLSPSIYCLFAGFLSFAKFIFV